MMKMIDGEVQFRFLFSQCHLSTNICSGELEYLPVFFTVYAPNLVAARTLAREISPSSRNIEPACIDGFFDPKSGQYVHIEDNATNTSVDDQLAKLAEATISSSVRLTRWNRYGAVAHSF